VKSGGEGHVIDGSPGPLDEASRTRLVREFRVALYEILDAWFPRVLDREHGGFLCDFDYRWRPSGSQNKMLEFQARQTRLAALAAAFLPDREDLRAAAEHGFSYLRDAMWDHEYGGFYRMLDRAGSPLESRSKHGHGTAYAISACVAHYRLTGGDQPLELLKRAFDWMERNAHDARFGGYFGYYRRDGRPVRDRVESAPEYPLRDPIGTPLGFKDVNTTKDLMETLGQVAGVWPDPLVVERLREMLDIIGRRVIVPPGACHMYFHPDWTPIPDCAYYGHNLHLAALLLNAADPLEAEARNKTESTARTLLDCALEHAWIPQTGGFALAGSVFGPIHLEDQVWFLDRKYWWPQAEALVALLHFAIQAGGVYSDRATTLWTYIKTHLVDARHGGWHKLGVDAGKWVRKLPKADPWRDGSHEGMALMKCIQALTEAEAS
jgi:mannobiose 2-epimerase